MATATLLPMARAVFYDALGNPLAGGFVNTYVPGGSTPKLTWQDAAETIANANPIVLDANGSCLLYGSGAYQLTVTDALGNQVPAYSGLSQDFLSVIIAAGSALGFVTTLPTIAALRANTASLGSLVYVEGYFTDADGGDGAFVHVATDTTSPDNGGTIIVDGASQRWYRETGGASWAAEWFGATFSSPTQDVTSALIAALAALPATGGDITLPSRQAVISSNIAITTQSTRLIARGGIGGWHDTGSLITSGTRLTWAGAAGGTMITVQPSVSATQVLYGCSVLDVYLDSGSGCATGLSIISCRDGVFRVSGQEFTSAFVKMNVSTSLGEQGDTQRNTVIINGRQLVETGPFLIMDGSPTADSSFNTISVAGDYGDANAIVLENCDSNSFPLIDMTRAVGGTGVGLLLKAKPTIFTARNNVFFRASVGAGGVFAQGTETDAFPSVGNQIYWYDKANGNPDPLIGTSATFYWASNTRPIGLREYNEVPGPYNYSSIDNAGHIKQSGNTGTIVSNGTLDIPLGIPLTSFVTSIMITPTLTPGYDAVSCTTTTLTIVNGPADNTFNWTVEGR